MDTIKSVRGVRDIIDVEAKKLRFVEGICRETAIRYGFKEIVLPTFEDIKLYTKGVGDTTDIVQKQMYEFEDKKGRKLVLRPEGTAGIVRVFNEHNLKEKFSLKRFFYFGSMFRYERPQKGRYREFYQFGTEIFSEESPAADLVLIKSIIEVFERLNINTELCINSVGCKDCRISYKQKLIDALEKEILCDDCKLRIEKNPLRILDCKTDSEKIKNVPNIIESLCDKCLEDYNNIKSLLKDQEINYFEDKMLVRGLDYYTGFVFEFKSKSLDAAQNTVCAGGRYDNLVNDLGGQDICACGCAFGIDRIMEVINSTIFQVEKNNKVGVGIVSNEYLNFALKVVDKIKNCVVVGPFSNRSLKSQMRCFDNEKCGYVIIVGKESLNNDIIVKNLEKNSQHIINIEKIKEEINI